MVKFYLEKGVCMKKNFLLLVALILCGCAQVTKRIMVVHPNEHGLSEDLEGKLFAIGCYGNGSTGLQYVDDKCKRYMAEFAYNRGYDFFSVLAQDGETNSSTSSYTINQPVTTYSNASVYSGGYSAYGYGSSTTYVPQTNYYTVTTHTKAYVFVLIDKTEKNKYKNYYKVSDYYMPEISNEE